MKTTKPSIKKLHKAIDEHKAQELDKKFKTNKFAKKYKEELETADYMDLLCENILEHSEEVKSWKRSSISQTVNLTYIFLAFIIGFSLCAVVVTPIVINSI